MKHQRMLFYTFAIIAILIILVATTAGGKAADPRAGEIFAVQNCSRCHAMGSSTVSNHPKAPPFRRIVRKYKIEDLEEGFAEGIVTGHNAMPEFTLTPREIDDLLAYMRRLKK
jgi:cytochrome c